MRESSDTWTVWTPIGDCGEEIGGGLGFVPGSNRAELLDAEMTMMEVEKLRLFKEQQSGEPEAEEGERRLPRARSSLTRQVTNQMG